MPETFAHPTSSPSTTIAMKRNKNLDFQQAWKQYAAAALGVAGVSAMASARWRRHKRRRNTLSTHQRISR
jgi:hypothetical protein